MQCAVCGQVIEHFIDMYGSLLQPRCRACHLDGRTWQQRDEQPQERRPAAMPLWPNEEQDRE